MLIAYLINRISMENSSLAESRGETASALLEPPSVQLARLSTHKPAFNKVMKKVSFITSLRKKPPLEKKDSSNQLNGLIFFSEPLKLQPKTPMVQQTASLRESEDSDSESVVMRSQSDASFLP